MTAKISRLTATLLSRKGSARPTLGLGLCDQAPGHKQVRTARAPAGQASGPASGDGNGRVRLSLRVDRKRHLRLRLAAAHEQQSIQEIAVAALDDYLARFSQGDLDGRCGCLNRDRRAGEADPAPAHDAVQDPARKEPKG